MIYLLTANGLKPGGSSTVHIYTTTIHRTTEETEYTEQTFITIGINITVRIHKDNNKNTFFFQN